MTKRTYSITTSKRTGTITLEELTDKVVVSGEVTPDGRLGDEAELLAFLERALFPYEDDPRPVEMNNLFGLGITASVNKDADGETCAIITKPERH